MRDFDNWLRWTRKNRDEFSDLSDTQLKTCYDDYYNCKCESCERRKELGYMPIQTGRSDCIAPDRQLDLRRNNVCR